MNDVRRLLSLALEARKDEASPKSGSPFGDYELLEVLGQGGMGVVYRARHIGIHRTVALKVIRNGLLATDGDVLRFRAEAAASLDHPNIVPVYHFGEYEAQPFFTMRLFERGTLAEELERELPSQRRAAELTSCIARAVQYAHQNGVLHRDLKPTNILLDEGGQPHVADFGIARRMDESPGGSLSPSESGHPDYMAPERLLGTARGPTVAGDVYGLGVIFYELLTGSVPRRDALFAAAPPSHRARVLPELNWICRRCLEVDPTQRYESAGALADDLDRCLRGELPKLSPAGVLAQFWWGIRRHPMWAAVLAAVSFVGVLTLVIAVWVGDWQTHRVREEILKVNRYAAQATAGQVLFKLRELSDQLSRCASDPAVARRIQAGLLTGPEPAETEAVLRSCGALSLFDGVRLFDERGLSLTRFPFGRQPTGTAFQFRDYFQGAHALGELNRRGAYVGRAIRSESDDQIKLPLAAPVYAEDRLVGVVLGTVGTDSTLASLELPKDDRRIALLVGLRDRDRFEADLPEQYMLLVHPQLAHGQAASVDSPALETLVRQARDAQISAAEQFVLSTSDRVLTSDPHVDPLLPGTWLAGISPVGNTSYAVIVETGQGVTAGAISTAMGQLIALSGALFAIGLAGVLGAGRLVAAWRRRALACSALRLEDAHRLPDSAE